MNLSITHNYQKSTAGTIFNLMIFPVTWGLKGKLAAQQLLVNKEKQKKLFDSEY